MLDFNKLIPQIKDVGQDTLIEGTSPTEILRNAQQAFESAADRPSLLKAKLRENGGHTFWPLAIPIEPFGSEIEIEAYPGMHTVVACDGSQIMPTAHEVYSCYLLNIGAMVIHYGCDEKPILTSFPRLFHKADEVYPLVDQRRVHVNDSVVSLERQLMELTKASELAVLHKHADMPLVTMVDGSLIPWNVDSMPDSYQTEYLQRMLEVLDVFCAERIPLIGYVSHSRSSDIVNNMRVWECPYPTSKCQTFAGISTKKISPVRQCGRCPTGCCFRANCRAVFAPACSHPARAGPQALVADTTSAFAICTPMQKSHDWKFRVGCTTTNKCSILLFQWPYRKQAKVSATPSHCPKHTTSQSFARQIANTSSIFSRPTWSASASAA